MSADPRQEYRDLLAYAKELKADPGSILKRARHLEDSCMEGILQEKCNVRVDSGKDTFIEAYPQVALQALQFQYRVFQDIEAKAGVVVEEDKTLEFVVTLAVPGETDND